MHGFEMGMNPYTIFPIPPSRTPFCFMTASQEHNNAPQVFIISDYIGIERKSLFMRSDLILEYGMNCLHAGDDGVNNAAGLVDMTWMLFRCY